ncbi:MAG: cyclase family protein [Lachnospiraceae bacterium]|nr:cyclase family protein [Lachnospiraceae bacterium]
MKVNNMIEFMEQLKCSTKIIDLTYTLEMNMPVWPTHARYSSTVYESYEYGDVAIQSLISLGEHSGTHIDAPRHFIPGATSVDKLRIDAVMGRGYLFDATNLKEKEPLSLEQVKRMENENGPIKKDDIILIRFGWDNKYRLQPNGHDFLNDWPGLGKEAAIYLKDKQVAAVGSDTLSLDVFGVTECVCHNILLGNGIPIIENICNLAELPVHSYVVGLPNKFKDGSGSPIRLIAFVDV